MCSHSVRRAFEIVTLFAALGLEGCQPRTIVVANTSTDEAAALRSPMRKMLVLARRRSGTSAAFPDAKDAGPCASTLRDVRGRDEIVWAAGTETVNPSNENQLAESASRVIVPELSRARFILPRS